MILSKSTSEQIAEIEARLQAQLAGNPSLLIADLEQFVSKANKHLRPTLALLFGTISGANHEALISLAAAIEMLHAATRAHDVLLDHVDQNHGRQTINASFATSAAVLAGDFAFAAAAQLAAATQQVGVMQKFSETLQFIVSGEITHMFRNGGGFNRESYYRWVHAKTASLFELACETAILIGSGENETMRMARQFGYQIGMALQIRDDILGFCGQPNTLQSLDSSDLRQGIFTLPAIFFFESRPEDPLLHSILQNNGHSQKALENLFIAIHQSNAIERSREEIKAFGRRGQEVLAKLPNSPARAELEQLTTQVINQSM